MNISKRNKLKAKRAPWSKTRSGRRAHARANVMRAMVLAQGISSINVINSQVVSDKLSKAKKAFATAEAAIAAFKAAASVPVYGSKTV